MRKWVWPSRGLRPRDAILTLTLVSHLLVAFGFPLPAPSRTPNESSPVYPCQNRPCGCRTADECWAGDCCCFTLEQKLAWAETQGIEPPDHVRPLVESRRTQSASQVESCCHEAESGSEPTPACCADRPAAECPQCASEAHEKKAPAAEPPLAGWVIGLFAQKCKGEGFAGAFSLEPVTVTDPVSIGLVEPECIDHPAGRPDRVTSVPRFPPTPPPRRA